MDSKLIYNVTVKLEPSVDEDWNSWMKDVHIPDVMKTGYFESYKFSQLLFQDDSEGKTYAIQYTCSSMDKLKEYQSTHAPALQKEHTDRYKGRFVAFRSILRIQDEG